MAGLEGGNAVLRLSVTDPLKGVSHSLQDKDSTPVDARVASDKTVLFEIPARPEEGKTGWRLLGDFVRTGGKTRRFVYVATGRQAGRHSTEWSRRAKVEWKVAKA
jgi:hypothetical protein